MSHLIWVGVGGALGAISRYLMSAWVVATWSKNFPIATLLVNVIGSLLIGIAFVLVVERLEHLPQARLILMVGFLGGFTTFSSFSLETYHLFVNGELLSAVMYVGASVILCLFAVAAGIWLARLF